ncbi:MAG: ABC transporter ATP-binding protein [ANME-2 cluster archaeon]|nr:ABC transporter ATP-binding protein [ANME-2 cluster archaeon]
MSQHQKTKQREEQAVIVQNISKRFRIPHEKKSTVKENIIGSIKGKRGYDEFQALQNISFTIKQGESIGIIGENGSGKSTLLKILAGVLSPDVGNVTINGKVAPFLELGVGFQSELSAKENVYLYGSILGMTKKEMDEKYDEILEFSELEKFENVKIKNFSSGMYARLAFATAVATEPDILLLDEVLAVGDEKFQMKCKEKMHEFRKSGVTIVLVSHSLSTIQDICDKAILLEHGTLKTSGNVWEVGSKYIQSLGIQTLNMPVLNAPVFSMIEDTKIALNWKINNPLELMDGIDLRIRDITDSEEGKLYVFKLPKNADTFEIPTSGIVHDNERLILERGKTYRWSVVARPAQISKYANSLGDMRIFSIKLNVIHGIED